MAGDAQFDFERLRRHWRPATRFLCYPPVEAFSPDFGEADFRRAALRSNAEPIPRPLAVCLRWPGSGESMPASRARSRASAGRERLLREAERLAPLFARDRDVCRVRFEEAPCEAADDIGRVLDSLGRHFRIAASPDSPIGIEAEWARVRADTPARLAALGFTELRLAIGADAMDEATEAERLTAGCREAGFEHVGVRFTNGGSGPTIRGFRRVLRRVLAGRPDGVGIGLGDRDADSQSGEGVSIRDPALEAGLRLRYIEQAADELTGAGYEYLGLGEYARDGSRLARARAAERLHHDAGGFSDTGPCDVLGLGVGAISAFGDACCRNAQHQSAWETAVDAEGLAIDCGIALDADDRLRADVINQLFRAWRIDVARTEARYGIDFAGYFADSLRELGPLAADGLLEIGSAAIEVGSPGCYLLRIIAGCFDRHRHHATAVAAATR